MSVMTNEQLDEAIEMAALANYPGLVPIVWGRNRECAERGIDPSEDFDNAWMKLEEETGMTFGQLSARAVKSDKYWARLETLAKLQKLNN